MVVVKKKRWGFLTMGRRRRGTLANGSWSRCPEAILTGGNNVAHGAKTLFIGQWCS
jgi:hypothetical protein